MSAEIISDPAFERAVVTVTSGRENELTDEEKRKLSPFEVQDKDRLIHCRDMSF